jgi:hypothetical protein
MKALMDDVRFEEGGVVVRMRKSTGKGVYPSVDVRTEWRALGSSASGTTDCTR